MKVKTLNGNLNIVGSNLRKYRNQQKLSQPALCRKLDLLGVTMYICDIYEIEYGKKLLRILKLWLFVRFWIYLLSSCLKILMCILKLKIGNEQLRSFPILSFYDTLSFNFTSVFSASIGVNSFKLILSISCASSASL